MRTPCVSRIAWQNMKWSPVASFSSSCCSFSPFKHPNLQLIRRVNARRVEGLGLEKHAQQEDMRNEHGPRIVYNLRNLELIASIGRWNPANDSREMGRARKHP